MRSGVGALVGTLLLVPTAQAERHARPRPADATRADAFEFNGQVTLVRFLELISQLSGRRIEHGVLPANELALAMRRPGWREALESVLATQGLRADIDDEVIRIHPVGSAAKETILLDIRILESTSSAARTFGPRWETQTATPEAWPVMALRLSLEQGRTLQVTQPFAHAGLDDAPLSLALTPRRARDGSLLLEVASPARADRPAFSAVLPLAAGRPSVLGGLPGAPTPPDAPPRESLLRVEATIDPAAH